MNIGIVTINDNNNFGNRLQNYALQYYIQKINSNFNVVTLKNDDFSNTKNHFILRVIKNLLRDTSTYSKNTKKYYKELKEFFKNNSKKYCAIWVNVCSLANIDYLIYAKKYCINTRIIHSHNSKNMEYSMVRRIMHIINRCIINKYANTFWACSKEAG